MGGPGGPLYLRLVLGCPTWSRCVTQRHPPSAGTCHPPAGLWCPPSPPPGVTPRTRHKPGPQNSSSCWALGHPPLPPFTGAEPTIPLNPKFC